MPSTRIYLERWTCLFQFMEGLVILSPGHKECLLVQRCQEPYYDQISSAIRGQIQYCTRENTRSTIRLYVCGAEDGSNNSHVKARQASISPKGATPQMDLWPKKDTTFASIGSHHYQLQWYCHPSENSQFRTSTQYQYWGVGRQVARHKKKKGRQVASAFEDGSFLWTPRHGMRDPIEMNCRARAHIAARDPSIARNGKQHQPDPSM